MGSFEIKVIIGGAVSIATALVGFIAIWVRLGGRLGGHERTIELLEEKSKSAEREIAELKSATHGIQIDIARRMGAIEAKLDFIKESVDALKGRRRNAAEK